MSDSHTKKQVYDHRLREFVRETQNVNFALNLGVPRSTISNWINSPNQEVITHEIFDLNDIQVRQSILSLEDKLRKITTRMRLLSLVIRIFGFQINYERLPKSKDKLRFLRVIDLACKSLPLQTVLRILKLSASRYHSWLRAFENDCLLDDMPSCPKVYLNRLTENEVHVMHDMATSEEFRHVSTSRLAVLAERLGKLFASPSTWNLYIRMRKWRRHRKRIHPGKPKVGLRCTAPNEIWHIDTTVFRLLDGTKAYLQAIIDNFSRRILAWRLSSKLEPSATALLLLKAYESRISTNNETQSVMIDAGVENINKAVMKLVSEDILQLILAQTDLSFSNSMIEAFWRIMKHQWLFLNQLDNINKLRRLVEFYVNQYNSILPHSAFQGQMPDEMYFQAGDDIPRQLGEARLKARKARMEENRRMNCEFCMA